MKVRWLPRIKGTTSLTSYFRCAPLEDAQHLLDVSLRQQAEVQDRFQVLTQRRIIAGFGLSVLLQIVVVYVPPLERAFRDCENPCIRPNPCLPLCQLFEAARIEQRDERAVDLEQACGAELVDDFGNGLAVGVDPLGELAVAAARQA